MKVLKLLLLFVCVLGFSSCGEKASDEDCKKVAKRKANFSGKEDKKDKKQVYDSVFDDCKSSWSKEKAVCLTNAMSRNQMISCQ